MSAVRTIIVSRPKILEFRAEMCILLDPDNSDRVGRNIATFVRTKVDELLVRLENLSDESRSKFKSRMQTGLVDCAESTFLWVGFAATELLQQVTMTRMEAVLQQLPKGLPALNDRMLLQIDPSHRPISSEILRWVAMAVRPLHVDELEVILGSEESGLVSSDQRIIDQILICGSFISISDAGDLSPHEMSTDGSRTVSLVHKSAREYLSLAHTRHIKALESFHFEPSIVHLEMATTCLASVGTGARWGEAYSDLQEHEVGVTGGRQSPVGVGGLTLGGGVGWTTPRTGFACDNVVNFEVVLASGGIVNANATCHSDLWRALKGGSSNFGIVARFDIDTFLASNMTLERRTIGPEHTDEYIGTVVDYANLDQSYDENAMVSVISYFPDADIMMTVTEVNTFNNASTTAFDNFNRMPIMTTTGKKSYTLPDVAAIDAPELAKSHDAQ